MPESSQWRSALARSLSALQEAYGTLTMPISQFLDTELVLTVLADHFPEDAPELAWAALCYHPFTALQTLSAEGRRAVAVARLLLPYPLSRSRWEEMLEQYKAVPESYRLYDTGAGTTALRRTSVLPERLDVMRRTLQSRPPARLRPARFADEPQRYRFFLRQEAHEVDIPGRALLSLTLPVSETPLEAPVSAERRAITVTLEELQVEADWMDQHAPAESGAARDWGARMRDLALGAVTERGIVPQEALTLDGLTHLVGIVGSGKSTLLMVLAVHLARRGYRIAIVQGDVASLLGDHAVLEVLRAADPQLRSLPLIGRSGRIQHLNRLHAALATVGSGATTDLAPEPTLLESLGKGHPGYELLSTVCPLDGLRQDEEPIPSGEEPCTRLYPRGMSETPEKRRDCPLMPRCPVHHPTQRLFDARIWLATPASLLSSGPQTPLVPEDIRYVELIMRCADVVLVDEADAVQVQFDDRFAPIEVLVGRDEAWLDRLAAQVSRQIYRPARPLVGRDNSFDRWVIVHNNVQQAVNRLYAWLREDADVRQWLSQKTFWGERLLQEVEVELAGLGSPTVPFRTASAAFVKGAPGGASRAERAPEFPAAWMDAVQRVLFDDDEGAARERLEVWLEPLTRDPASAVSVRQREKLVHRLLVALVVSVLDHALRTLIAEWSVAEETLELDRGSGGVFYRPGGSPARLIPDPPMGTTLGFQYHENGEPGEGELRLFQIRGLGRSLLYHLHDALLDSHGIRGPHVLLTSGTSWAPGSWRYDLHVPPALVLRSHRHAAPAAVRPPGDKPEDVRRGADTGGPQIACTFSPLPDPEDPNGRRLTVSGRTSPGDRIRSLRAMVRELARPRGFGTTRRSRFDDEFERLEPHRKRILLVTGSYDEAEALGQTLREELQVESDQDVLTLVPSSDGELAQPPPGSLLRSMLPTLADRRARFLVAPLQAMERGHNILVGQEAAIGSVYFLVRPYPRPGDPYTAIHRINSWGMRYFQGGAVSPLPLSVEARRFRGAAQERWTDLLAGEDTYRGMADRTDLLWTQLVLVWQCIGRLLRGGVSARVHFVDAKWAEVSAGLVDGPSADTEATSMLVGFRRILEEALTHDDPNHRAVAEALYGPFARSLAHVEGIHTSDH